MFDANESRLHYLSCVLAPGPDRRLVQVYIASSRGFPHRTFQIVSDGEGENQTRFERRSTVRRQGIRGSGCALLLLARFPALQSSNVFSKLRRSQCFEFPAGKDQIIVRYPSLNPEVLVMNTPSHAAALLFSSPDPNKIRTGSRLLGLVAGLQIA